MSSVLIGNWDAVVVPTPQNSTNISPNLEPIVTANLRVAFCCHRRLLTMAQRCLDRDRLPLQLVLP
jgi:hypothetical protein